MWILRVREWSRSINVPIAVLLTLTRACASVQIAHRTDASGSKYVNATGLFPQNDKIHTKFSNRTHVWLLTGCCCRDLRWDDARASRHVVVNARASSRNLRLSAHRRWRWPYMRRNNDDVYRSYRSDLIVSLYMCTIWIGYGMGLKYVETINSIITLRESDIIAVHNMFCVSVLRHSEHSFST